MPPKRVEREAALKPRTSRSRVAKSSPKTTRAATTPRSTPRRTKSKTSTRSTQTTPTQAKTPTSPSTPTRTRQRKRVNTVGSSSSPIRDDSLEPSHSPSPPPPQHKSSDPEEATGFYGLGIVRSVTQQARAFFSGWGYGFGKSDATTPKRKTRQKKRGPKKNH